eukprot:2091268-Amphidinium_carterae.2
MEALGCLGNVQQFVLDLGARMAVLTQLGDRGHPKVPQCLTQGQLALQFDIAAAAVAAAAAAAAECAQVPTSSTLEVCIDVAVEPHNVNVQVSEQHTHGCFACKRRLLL